jgi:hypothetical protein
MLLVEQIEPPRSSGGIEHVRTVDQATPSKVVAIGRDVYGIEVGEVVIVDGYRSGLDMGSDLYLVEMEMCLGVRE